MKKYRFALIISAVLLVAMTAVPLWAAEMVISTKTVTQTPPATLYVSKWAESDSNPVFDPTEKTYYPCVIKIADTYQMYYADENSIRYTTSSDGINWSNGTEITFTTGPTPAKQNHPWVVYNGSKYKLWYWNSINSSTSKLYMATSSDGISWAEQSAISIISGMAYSFFYNARVIWNGTNYEGWFDNNGGKIEYTNSSNGIDWGTATLCVFNGYSGEFTPPCVVKLDSIYYMWFGYKAVDPEPNGYSNTGIGYANSSNGINWEVKFSPIFAINDSGATWRNYRTYTPNVIKEDNTWKIWFTGKSSDGNYAIGYAATNYWEPDYTIIQEAVNTATTGDTINIAAGIYNITATILLDKSLTLTGPQAGFDPRPSFGSTRITGDTWGEAILDANGSIATLIDIRANNIVLDGLEVKGGTGDMIYSSSSYTTDSAVIRYCIVHDSFNYPSSSGDEGIQLKKAPNSLIEFNHIFRTYGDGINIASGSINGTIRSNEVHDIKSENGGIYVYDITDAIDYNTTIIGNLVYDCADEGINFGHKGGNDETDAGGRIIDNVVHDAVDGIEVNFSHVLIERNEIYNCTSDHGAIQLSPFNDISHITITGNSIHDNTMSEGVDSLNLGAILVGVTTDAATVTINYNNIYNNTSYGIYNETSVTINAEKNWWDDDDPSNNVSNNVSYSPWLNDSIADFEKADTQTRTDIGPSGGQVKVSITSTPDGSNYLDVYQVGSLSGSPVTSGETFPEGFDKRSNIIWGINKTGIVTATMVFDYSNQSGVSDASTIEILKRDNAQDNTWKEVSETSRDDAAKTITLTGVTEFSEFALGAGASENALPVELASFTAENCSGGVLLKWCTESETENQGYILEKWTIDNGQLTIKDEEWATVANYLSDPALVGQGSTTESHMYQYVDDAVQSGVTYAYRLGDVDYNSKIIWHDKIEVEVEAEKEKIPTEFGLQKAYPNPFNPSVTLRYGLTEDAHTTLLIYDMRGQLIQILQNAFQSAGTYEVTWQPVNLGSGVYIICLQSGNNTNLQKVVFVK